MGVRQLIQNHLRDVQGKFQDQFQSLEIEIQRRDELISILQNRINVLEGHCDDDHVMTPIGEADREIGSSESSTTGSSIELPFMVSSVSVIARHCPTRFCRLVALRLNVFSVPLNPRLHLL